MNFRKLRAKLFGYNFNPLFGGMKNKVHVEVKIIRANGKVEYIYAKNVNTTAGLNVARRQLYDPAYALATTVCQYIALSADTVAPVAGDTTLAGERTDNGLQRAAGTYSSGGNGVWNQVKTFTYTGGCSITLAKSGIFDASGSGNMYHAALFGSTATLNTNDQIQVTWTGTLS